MTAAHILRTLKAAPFQPFAMHLADQRSVVIRHPEMIQLIGGGRIALVCDPLVPLANGDPEAIDVLLIVSLRPVELSSRS